ncbi:membrane-spanning 4-domains subfamily A member 13 [Alexandromys fortis]|uniref:membrane-spanning 4-domains subfamily A member 13 n=1 Tax=Alexandromys fortis TaxID=100897 RepID=UPI0021533F71|nr:membrane-spanning 4-domains subfamily A member 13 [Microtus fortis]
MGCRNSKISSSNTVVLGVIQIMLGVYHVLMWYFLLLLYMGQIKGVFGTYEPLTYKMGTGLWGLTFIISGTFTVRAAKHQNNKYLLLCALSMNILCILVTIIAASLTVVELAHFRSVSYRNYGQAKLGREVSRILLFSYPLEFGIALTYSVCSCSYLGREQEDSLESVTEVMESTF